MAFSMSGYITTSSLMKGTSLRNASCIFMMAGDDFLGKRNSRACATKAHTLLYYYKEKVGE